MNFRRKLAMVVSVVAIAVLMIALVAMPAGALTQTPAQPGRGAVVNAPPPVPVPNIINYQGYLTDSSGNPITGVITMTFSIYDTETGGTAIWTEVQDVTVTDGLFNVLLGSINPIDAIHLTGESYLGVQVGSDPEMTPRQRLVSVAYTLRSATANYANNADNLDNMDSTEFAFAAHEHDTDYVNVDGDTMTGQLVLPVDGLVAGTDQLVLTGGNVGIGTTSPSYTLTVGDGFGTRTIAVDGQQGGWVSYKWLAGGTEKWSAHLPGTDNLYFRNASATDVMVLRQDGNVGIGTTTPGYTLTVGDGFGTRTIAVDGQQGGWVSYKWLAGGVEKWSAHLPGTDNLYFRNASDTDVMVLRQDGNVGIGATTPGYKLEVQGTVYGTSSGTEGLLATSMGGVLGYQSSSGNIGKLGTATEGVYGKSTSGWGVYAEGVEGVRGYSTSSYGVYGRTMSTSRGVYGYSSGGEGVYGEGPTGVYGYGTTHDFYAGNIGTYDPFTGAHEAKLADDFPEDIRPGLIVSVTGETQVRIHEGEITFSSTLPTVQLSDSPDDKKVFGVLTSETPLPEDHWYESGEGDRFGTVNALGEGRVWVTNINGDIEAGDYITTSAIAGYGQKQADDLLHSYTLGKAIESVDWSAVTETVDFNGQTYKAYPIAVVYTSG